MFNRTYPVRERMAEATFGGSVYRRSQPCTAEEERPVRDGARAGNEKCFDKKTKVYQCKIERLRKL